MKRGWIVASLVFLVLFSGTVWQSASPRTASSSTNRESAPPGTSLKRSVHHWEFPIDGLPGTANYFREAVEDCGAIGSVDQSSKK